MLSIRYKEESSVAPQIAAVLAAIAQEGSWFAVRPRHASDAECILDRLLLLIQANITRFSV